MRSQPKAMGWALTALIGACASEPTAGTGSSGGAGSGSTTGAVAATTTSADVTDAGVTVGGATQSGADTTTGAGSETGDPDVTCPSDPVEGPAGDDPAPEAHATFHSLGLYWKPPDAAADDACALQIRRRGQCEWIDLEPLWFDGNAHVGAEAHTGEYRGSVVDLVPATTYELRLALGSGRTFSLPVTTMDEAFPIAQTIEVASTDTPLIVDQGGTADGYVLYTAAEGGATIDVAKTAAAAVEIQASYVIVRGLTVRGASAHGIRLGAVDHVVIEDCDIADWGSPVASGQLTGFGVNMQSGIYSNDEALSHVVVQRNAIHHPTYDTNSWDEFDPVDGPDSFVHPGGPQGISFERSAGHHVIRYNHIFSDDEHKYNDGMGGSPNFSYTGFPHRDSDVYGNVVTHVWDDAIEVEGAGMNVRVFGNYVEQTFVGFGMATQSLGPFHLYRNVSGFSQRGTIESGSQTRGGMLAKIGAEPESLEYARGRIAVYHNTITQPASSFDGGPGGLAGGITYTSNTKVQQNIESRNNLLHMRRMQDCAISDPNENATNDFDSDLSNGTFCTADSQEANAIAGVPVYAADNAEGVWFLDATSPGFDVAVAQPGWNRRFGGAGPDMGAFEVGAPALRFGLEADWSEWARWVWGE